LFDWGFGDLETGQDHERERALHVSVGKNNSGVHLAALGKKVLPGKAPRLHKQGPTMAEPGRTNNQEVPEKKAEDEKGP